MWFLVAEYPGVSDYSLAGITSGLSASAATANPRAMFRVRMLLPAIAADSNEHWRRNSLLPIFFFVIFRFTSSMYRTGRAGIV